MSGIKSHLPLPRRTFGQPLPEDELLVALRAENAGRSAGGELQSEMMAATGLDPVSILNPARVKLAADEQRQIVEELQRLLAADDAAGFFARMKRKDRDVIEAQIDKTNQYIGMLNTELKKAEEKASMAERM